MSEYQLSILEEIRNHSSNSMNEYIYSIGI